MSFIKLISIKAILYYCDRVSLLTIKLFAEKI